MDSRVPERVGQSPTELMTGEKPPHWLELLGFDREGCRRSVGISNRGVELFQRA